MVPPYSLVAVKPLSEEEIKNIEGLDLEYLEENYDSTGYMVLDTEAWEDYPGLTKSMKPITLWTDRGFKYFYVVYLEILKVYGISKGREIFKNSKLYKLYNTIPAGFFLYTYMSVSRSPQVYADAQEYEPGSDTDIFLFTYGKSGPDLS